jgi:hypothetical protein
VHYRFVSLNQPEQRPECMADRHDGGGPLNRDQGIGPEHLTFVNSGSAFC